MLVQTGCLSVFTNGFLAQKYDYVSPDVDDGSIAQSPTSGRDGRGGITFVTGNDANTFAYPLYTQDSIPAADTQIFGIALRQTATQHALGGRLLTLVDGGEDVFGETTQVGINLMPDGTLQAVRANIAGSGIVLRGLEDSSPQLTLLGQSDTTVDATDTEFLVIEVFHDSSVGSVTATFYDDAGTIKGAWSLMNVNTAVSGRNQSNSYCYGGYAFTNEAGDTRFHQDLQAVISDLYIINNIVNPDDSRDPVSSIGDRKPQALLPVSDGALSQWTPDPVQSHYLNVNETPPDSGTTNNITDTVDDKDVFGMAEATSSDGQAYLAYSAFLTSDIPSECVSNDPVTFEALVYMEQTDPSEVHTSASDTSACNLTDFVGRRAQTVCSLKQNGDKVTYRPNASTTGTFYAFLTPLDAPPRIQNASGPSRYSACIFNAGYNMENVGARVSYTLPFTQPWNGLAVDTNDMLDTAGDFFEFHLSEIGIGIDAGLMNNAVVPPVAFSPYTSELIGFHFREDVEGSPYYWIGPSFAYAGETIYSISGDPKFKLVRNDPNIELYEDFTLRETFTPGVMPTHLNPFVFAGRWGFVSPFGYIRRPGIKEAFVSIGGSDCVTATYLYDNLDPGSWSEPPTWTEWLQWGVEFDINGDALILDPNNPGVPDNPVFGYDINTRLEFSLEGGSVVLRIYDWINYLDNITNDAGVGVFTYSRGFSNTDDFVLGSAWPVGPPVFPFPSLESTYPTTATSMPLRLACVATENSDFALPAQAGIKDVAFTFVGESGPAPFAGVMRQSGTNRLGTSAEAPSTEYRYKQSMLSTTPGDTNITANEFNDAQHGYSKEA